jgi:hypothetical protein
VCMIAANTPNRVIVADILGGVCIIAANTPNRVIVAGKNEAA